MSSSAYYQQRQQQHPRSRAGSNTNTTSTTTYDKSRLPGGSVGYPTMSANPSPPPRTGSANNNTTVGRYFEPCAATASMFLYAQGTSVVCCHYDTLAIERRFARHAEEVQLVAVDNHSDIGAGRLVVSYDAGQTAIVWDLLTGDEVARFASYENLTCAAWMRNGNVAFGNSQGNVILFEPTTSEHLSARTIDQIAITAISPAADCRTFAIGYQNGSLLIATLQPRFTILHNLTTSRGPSPIVTLSWHASSVRSKSDMLAVQTNDGDLRVWSVSKAYSSDDPAKIVRILKRTENYLTGPNWMGWSKNGRIVQFSEAETISWDVRTKHVTYDTIPTLEAIRGLAVYGPGATLFTLGPHNTVQQFDLNSPAMMVQNVQHPANLLPPSPPISLEDKQQSLDQQVLAGTPEINNTDVQIAFRPSDMSESEGEAVSEDPRDQVTRDHHGVDDRSPLARFLQQSDRESSDTEAYRPTTPASNISRSTVSISSSTSQQAARLGGGGGVGYAESMVSRGMTENTYISAGSSLRSGVAPSSRLRGYSQTQGSQRHNQRESMSTTSSISVGSSAAQGGHQYHSTARRPSRLRNEIPQSPDVSQSRSQSHTPQQQPPQPQQPRATDLFQFTKSRLADVPYKAPFSSDPSRLTNDDLRKQMLSTIFGWHRDVDELVRDEMARHPPGSTNRILLAKWLGDLEDTDAADIMAMGSEHMTSSDWMLLALSGISGANGPGSSPSSAQHKLGRAYVRRLLEGGDVHAAATIMVGLGDHNDAVEIYVSHKKHMEALLLTCLFFPAAWERQEQIVKKWGEWAVQHGQQQLAIRCFACTGRESTEPWTSPSAQQLSFPSIGQAVNAGGNAGVSPGAELASPPLSPPVMNHGPQRSVAKNASLKLITSFGGSGQGQQGLGKNKLLAHVDDGKTPVVRTAVGGYHDDDDVRDDDNDDDADPATAILRGNRSQFNTPASARPGHGFGRQRLPSIGEAPDSGNRDLLTAIARDGDPYANAFQSIDVHMQQQTQMQTQMQENSRNLERARPNTASPRLVKDNHTGHSQRTRNHPPPSPSPAAISALMDTAANARRNGSRSRIPTGLDLSLPGFKDSLPEGGTVTSPEPSANSSVRYHWPSRRRGPGSVAGSVASSVSVASSALSGTSSVVGRRYRGQEKGLEKDQGKSLDDYIHSLDAATQQSKRQQQQPRGSSRDGRSTTTASTATHTRESSRTRRENNASRGESRGRAAQRSYTPAGGKRSPKSPVPMSPEDLINLATPRDGYSVSGHSVSGHSVSGRRTHNTSRSRSRARGTSTGRATSRTRSTDRGARKVPQALDLRAGNRSPSSPQPMSATQAQGQGHHYGSDDDEDYRQAVEAQERFRRRNNRSTSRASRTTTATNTTTGETLREGLTSPVSVRSTSAWSTRETAREKKDRDRKIGAPLPTPAPMQLVTDSAGDLRVIKDERQLKKEAAARELEARRKSLARRPSAPPIMHPDELNPGTGGGGLPTLMELPSTTYVPPRKEDLPSRSASVDPNAGRSMYANRPGGSGPALIGLPATPRAMRLVLEKGGSANAGPVPPIPTTFAQAPASQTLTQSQSQSQQTQSQGQLQASPTRPSPTSRSPPIPEEQPADIPLLLPSTVYTPPPRMAAQIGRSMSAPPVDLVQPAHHSRRPSAANINVVPPLPLARRPSHDAAFPSRRPSQDAGVNPNANMIPPPPPPPPPPPAHPPMLKELQHLAQPPPPPPAPLPHLAGPKPVVYGGSSGTIEIVMDEEGVSPTQHHNQSQQIPPQLQQLSQAQYQPQPRIPTASEATVPIIATPNPRQQQQQQSHTPLQTPSQTPFQLSSQSLAQLQAQNQNLSQSQTQAQSHAQQQNHTRGRSSADHSLGARISRATERMRSASRTRGSVSSGVGGIGGMQIQHGGLQHSTQGYETVSSQGHSHGQGHGHGGHSYSLSQSSASASVSTPAYSLHNSPPGQGQGQTLGQQVFGQGQGQSGQQTPGQQTLGQGQYRAQSQMVLQQVQAQVAQQEGRNEYRTGLHRSEMI